ncbi:MAG: hypothetical protein IJO39_06530, partial [Clostridia bacterium]|nr:hypothetical protein [Clostridia bacterium]
PSKKNQSGGIYYIQLLRLSGGRKVTKGRVNRAGRRLDLLLETHTPPLTPANQHSAQSAEYHCPKGNFTPAQPEYHSARSAEYH